MVDNRILIPIDFTPASDKAVEFGIFIAQKCHGSICLLHVFEDGDMSIGDCELKLQALSNKINTDDNIMCEHLCIKGNIFTVIPETAAKSGFRMMLIASHGPKSLRQKL